MLTWVIANSNLLIKIKWSTTTSRVTATIVSLCVVVNVNLSSDHGSQAFPVHDLIHSLAITTWGRLLLQVNGPLFYSSFDRWSLQYSHSSASFKHSNMNLNIILHGQHSESSGDGWITANIPPQVVFKLCWNSILHHAVGMWDSWNTFLVIGQKMRF